MNRLSVRTPLSLICALCPAMVDQADTVCCLAGDSFPLEKVHEAILETEMTGRKGKVFLEG